MVYTVLPKSVPEQIIKLNLINLIKQIITQDSYWKVKQKSKG